MPAMTLAPERSKENLRGRGKASHVIIGHTSHVTCYTSHVTRHTSQASCALTLCSQCCYYSAWAQTAANQCNCQPVCVCMCVHVHARAQAHCMNPSHLGSTCARAFNSPSKCFHSLLLLKTHNRFFPRKIRNMFIRGLKGRGIGSFRIIDTDTVAENDKSVTVFG